jgi:fumarylacetoacetate (FAA) hydrolase
MKLLTYATAEAPNVPKLGALLGEAVIDLQEARTWAQGARCLPAEEMPNSMLDLIHRGERIWNYTRSLIECLEGEDTFRLKGAHRLPIGIPTERVILYPPLPRPMGMRDFNAFEVHVAAVNALRNRSVPEAWYKFPVFFFTNPNSIFGPGEVIPYPSYTQELDYELEAAIVIGKPGINIPVERAGEYIFGYTIFNDWSARDVQLLEMRVGLGPAKGKDFASSLGPWIVTPDELADRATERAGVYDLQMTARVNGVERSRGNLKDLHYSFCEMIARASADAWLLPGEVLGSGTVGSGCLLELTKGEGPWLQPGDIVELEIEHLGSLVNRIGKPGNPA